MAETKQPKKVSGNKSSELIIGMAASKLSSAVKSFQEAATIINQFEERVTQGTLQIGNMEDQIGGLDQEFKNKKAQIVIDTQLEYDTNRETFAQQWLAEHNMVSVLGSTWSKMESDLNDALANTEKEVKKEVAIVTNRLTADHKNATDILDMQHKMKEAENVATIKQLTEKCTFLQTQTESLTKQLDAAREANVKIAQAGAIGTLNVGNPQR